MEKKSIIVTLVISLVAAAAGYMAGSYNNEETTAVIAPAHDKSSNSLTESRSGGYRFINPLLECDQYAASKLNSIVKLETQVKDYIQVAQNEGRVNFVSVYFRDLNNGPWIGINENEIYSPASLLKVPIMMGVLKKAEKDPALLSKKIKYTRRLDMAVDPNILDGKLIQIGESYTVENLLERMIEHSDNEAKEMLLALIGEQFLVKVIEDIGIYLKGVNAANDFVSVRQYSGFFRLLYNATYLNRDMSEKALSILTRTSFEKGLTAKLPKETIVAHKFGERGMANSNLRQLHDCGIVYFKGNPYLICVMTRGIDFEKQGTAIAEISSIIYKNVEEVNR
jgi:beta-lactamase class A